MGRDFKGIKQDLIARAGEMITSIVRSGMSSQQAAADAKDAREQYRGLPADELAQILIRRAARKTKWEGAANGLAVSGCEAVVASPVPEPSHKVAAGAGAVTLLLGDMAYATRVQMQLLLSIAELYGCPFKPDDEETATGRNLLVDLWPLASDAPGSGIHSRQHRRGIRR